MGWGWDEGFLRDGDGMRMGRGWGCTGDEDGTGSG